MVLEDLGQSDGHELLLAEGAQEFLLELADARLLVERDDAADGRLAVGRYVGYAELALHRVGQRHREVHERLVSHRDVLADRADYLQFGARESVNRGFFFFFLWCV